MELFKLEQGVYYGVLLTWSLGIKNTLESRAFFMAQKTRKNIWCRRIFTGITYTNFLLSSITLASARIYYYYLVSSFSSGNGSLVGWLFCFFGKVEDGCLGFADCFKE